MSAPRERKADTAASAALFLVILAVSIALAMMTDLPVVTRGIIAVVAGIAAAATTFVIVRRRTSR